MPRPLGNGGDYFGSFKSGLAATSRSARSFYLKFSHFVSFLQGHGPRGDQCYSTLGFATHFCPVLLDRCLRFEYSIGSSSALIWSGSCLLVGGCLISCPALQVLLYPIVRHRAMCYERQLEVFHITPVLWILWDMSKRVNGNSRLIVWQFVKNTQIQLQWCFLRSCAGGIITVQVSVLKKIKFQLGPGAWRMSQILMHPYLSPA